MPRVPCSKRGACAHREGQSQGSYASHYGGLTMRRTANDTDVRAAFDRFHATSTTNRKSAASQLHTDMKRAGGPVSKEEDK